MSPYRLAVTIFPFLVLIAELGDCAPYNSVHEGISDAVIIIAIDIYLQIFERSRSPGKVDFLLSTMFFALGVALNFLVTLLLVGRIFLMQRRHNRLTGMLFSKRLSTSADA